MNTYNKYFNNAWEYLGTLHPIVDLQGETLDLRVKPKVSKSQYCHYISAIYAVIAIGIREQFITPHVDGHGCVTLIKYRGSK